MTYGADYSSRELSVFELGSFKDYDIRFLIRYIGWPDNPKCISHYPGAYQPHVDGGRTVLLVAAQRICDPAGGFGGAAAMARRALGDAKSIGYPDNLPIFFCADGWLATHNISVATYVKQIQQALISKGFVLGISDPNSGWPTTSTPRPASKRCCGSSGRPAACRPATWGSTTGPACCPEDRDRIPHAVNRTQ